jgi:hypothetical protein
MTQPKSLLDPFDIFRGLASRLERGLELAAGRGVRADGFTRMMHQALGASLLARRLSRQIQDGLLSALNLPSRSDLLQLGERLQALEDRIIELSADMAVRKSDRSIAAPRSALPAPPRTKRPPQMAAPTAAAAKRQRRSARP